MDELPSIREAMFVHLDKPSPARVYDYLLDGGRNFAADRELAKKLIARVPGAQRAAQINRIFLRRVVLYLISQGVRQFLDLGSGILTVGNVHDITHKHASGTTVVYVDHDAVATACSALLLQDIPTAAAVRADLREVDAVLSDPTVQVLLDFEQPVAVLMCAVLHFVPDTDDPAGIVGRYIEALCPGSYLAISHATADHDPDEVAAGVRLYQEGGIPITARSHTAVSRLFTGLELVEPGVVLTSQWHPDGPDPDDPRRSLSYAGLGIKPLHGADADSLPTDSVTALAVPTPIPTGSAPGPQTRTAEALSCQAVPGAADVVARWMQRGVVGFRHRRVSAACHRQPRHAETRVHGTAL